MNLVRNQCDLVGSVPMNGYLFFLCSFLVSLKNCIYLRAHSDKVMSTKCQKVKIMMMVKKNKKKQCNQTRALVSALCSNAHTLTQRTSAIHAHRRQHEENTQKLYVHRLQNYAE